MYNNNNKGKKYNTGQENNYTYREVDHERHEIIERFAHRQDTIHLTPFIEGFSNYLKPTPWFDVRRFAPMVFAQNETRRIDLRQVARSSSAFFQRRAQFHIAVIKQSLSIWPRLKAHNHFCKKLHKRHNGHLTLLKNICDDLPRYAKHLHPIRVGFNSHFLAMVKFECIACLHHIADLKGVKAWAHFSIGCSGELLTVLVHDTKAGFAEARSCERGKTMLRPGETVNGVAAEFPLCSLERIMRLRDLLPIDLRGYLIYNDLAGGRG